jgi:hypothetical protein
MMPSNKQYPAIHAVNKRENATVCIVSAKEKKIARDVATSQSRAIH